jgi:PPE-SVP subfamily C-terminal region
VQEAVSIGSTLAATPTRFLTSLSQGGTTGLGGDPLLGGSLLNGITQFIDTKLGAAVKILGNQFTSATQAVSARLAQASSIGGLSVPHGWAAAAPAMSRAAPVLPQTTVSPPSASAGMPGGPFTQAMMGALTGRGISSFASKVPPKVMARSPAGG